MNIIVCLRLPIIFVCLVRVLRQALLPMSMLEWLVYRWEPTSRWAHQWTKHTPSKCGVVLRGRQWKRTVPRLIAGRAGSRTIRSVTTTRCCYFIRSFCERINDRGDGDVAFRTGAAKWNKVDCCLIARNRPWTTRGSGATKTPIST